MNDERKLFVHRNIITIPCKGHIYFIWRNIFFTFYWIGINAKANIWTFLYHILKLQFCFYSFLSPPWTNSLNSIIPWWTFCRMEIGWLIDRFLNAFKGNQQRSKKCKVKLENNMNVCNDKIVMISINNAPNLCIVHTKIFPFYCFALIHYPHTYAKMTSLFFIKTNTKMKNEQIRIFK